MDNTIKAQLDAQDEKIEAIYQSVEKTRKYLLIIMWSSLAMIALPLLAAVAIVPMLINTFSSYANSLTGF